ncbi:hypothetical protein [Streptomyces qinzhouensis]|uniref:Uncharacterized protein n=1 Tax=Streptomyces qinzhouensis TaxID=2599401 RepID=A0A5B8J4J0_9ACTN|nr:hypothetical protein [Streptomyces qinzhouensis]QDY76177.1 hypothetical protein FQU76_06170 [Streptomyces qinzhouensis]
MPNHMQETAPTLAAAMRNAVEVGAAVVWWTAVLAGLGIVTVIAHDDLNGDGEEPPEGRFRISIADRTGVDRTRSSRMHRNDAGHPTGSPSPYTTLDPPEPEWPPCVCGRPVCPDGPAAPGEEAEDDR